MEIAAVTHVGRVSHVHPATDKSQCPSVFLHRGIKRQVVVVSGGIYVDRPARIRGARVHIKRENKMLFGNAAIGRGEGIKKQGARRKIHDGRTGDPNRIDVATPEAV